MDMGGVTLLTTRATFPVLKRLRQTARPPLVVYLSRYKKAVGSAAFCPILPLSLPVYTRCQLILPPVPIEEQLPCFCEARVSTSQIRPAVSPNILTFLLGYLTSPRATHTDRFSSQIRGYSNGCKWQEGERRGREG